MSAATNALGLTSVPALASWMQKAIGAPVASSDQWCYAAHQLTNGSFSCPDTLATGLTPGQPVSAQTWYQAYYNYLQNGNASSQTPGGNNTAPSNGGAGSGGAGGSTTTGGGTVSTPPVGTLFGIPIFVILIALAVGIWYFGFRE